MDIRHLSHFLAVIEHKSVGRAAEHLQITQPALSKSIRRLEEILQVKLFDRGAEGMIPTSFGLALAERSRMICHEMKSAREEMDALRGVHRGSVTVGAGPSIVGDVLARAVARMSTKRPEMRVSVVEGMMDTLMPALKRGEIDFVVGTEAPPSMPEGISSEQVFQDEVCVVARAAHPLARRAGGLPILREYPWVLTEDVDPLRSKLDQIFLAAKLAPPVPQVTTNSARFMKSMVLSGDYLSFLPRLLIRLEEQARLIAPLRIAGTVWTRSVHIVRRTRASSSPASRMLVSEIRAAARSFGRPVAAAQ